MYQKIKSILDLIFSFLLIVLCSPLIFVVLIGSSIAHRSNPVFAQERTGKNGVPFTLYKIKSMRDIVQGEDNSDAARLTRFGRFLRQTSLDETPQLLNILRGDMSFIGPRPQIHAYYSMMSFRERRRYNVKPGLSGWSQVNGRNEITWRKRFEQDIWYIENVSLLLDLWIAWHTIMMVLWGKGVSNGAHVTMPTLHEELESKCVACEQLEKMPQILADLVRNNPNAIISFSLYDKGNIHPTSKNPQHIFAYQCADGENIKYKNVYINIWRCLNGCFNASSMGTAGPFNVEISNNSVIITQKSTTIIWHDRQLKYVIREISA